VREPLGSPGLAGGRLPADVGAERTEDVVHGSGPGLPAGSDAVDELKLGQDGESVPSCDGGVKCQVAELIGGEHLMLGQHVAQVAISVGEMSSKLDEQTCLVMRHEKPHWSRLRSWS